MRLAPWLLAGLLGFCLYAITLRGTYIYDDEYIAREDPRLHSESLWPKFWTQAWFPKGQDRLYRPLASASFAVEWQLFGNRPWVFHLTNVLIFAATCAGVAELGRRLGGERLGYFAGTLFAVHPVHVEAVAGLVGRAELMSTGAMVWGIVLALPVTIAMTYPSRDSVRITPRLFGEDLNALRIAWIVLLFIVALFSKEQAILFPVFVGALFLWRKPADARQGQRAKGLMVCLMWLDAAYLIIRENSRMKFSWDPGPLNWTVQPLIRASGLDRWLIPFTALGHYARLLVFPNHQSLDYGYAIISYVQSRSDPFLWLGTGAALVGTVSLITAIAKRAWLAAWLLLGIGLSYGLVSNFAGIIGTIMAERLMFLPSVFFAILVAWLVLKLPTRGAVGVLAVCLVLGAARTEVYAHQWNNRLGLYQEQAAENPRSEHIWSLLAGEYAEEHNYPAAMMAAEQMQRIDSDYWVGWYMAADFAMEMGDYPQAQRDLQRAWDCKISGYLEINALRGKIAARQKQSWRRGLQHGKIKHNVPSTNF